MAAAKKAKTTAAKSTRQEPEPKAKSEAAPKHKSQPKTAAKPKKAAPKATKAKSSASADSKTRSAPKPKAQPKPKAAPPAAKSKSKSAADKYADPALRDRLKDEIMKGDKGGKPGQWSARKAQLLASEYKKAGGKYNNDEDHKTEDQKHLDQWTDEDWKTSDGKAADREGGTTRYLPAEAWDKLTPAQKKETNAKKQAGSRQGKQYVGNTDEAKGARKEASESTDSPKKPAAKAPARKPPKRAAQASKDQADSGKKAKPNGEPRKAPKAKTRKKASD